MGSLIPALIENAPEGYLLCNGQAVSRTTYSALFAEIGTTFGEGDGSTTFNLPDLRSRFIKGKEDSETLGQLNEAGLPDHNHTVTGGQAWASISPSAGGVAIIQTVTTSNASESNPIYGASDTVTPKNISVNWFIKY